MNSNDTGCPSALMWKYVYTNSPVETSQNCNMFSSLMVATNFSVWFTNVKYFIFVPYIFKIRSVFLVNSNRMPLKHSKILINQHKFICIRYFVWPAVNAVFSSYHTLKYIIVYDSCPYGRKNTIGVPETLIVKMLDLLLILFTNKL